MVASVSRYRVASCHSNECSARTTQTTNRLHRRTSAGLDLKTFGFKSRPVVFPSIIGARRVATAIGNHARVAD